MDGTVRTPVLDSIVFVVLTLVPVCIFPPGGRSECFKPLASPRFLHYSASLHLVDMLPPPLPMGDTTDTHSLTSEEGWGTSCWLLPDTNLSITSPIPHSLMSHCALLPSISLPLIVKRYGLKWFPVYCWRKWLYFLPALSPDDRASTRLRERQPTPSNQMPIYLPMNDT